jgi:hypothetical protein
VGKELHRMMAGPLAQLIERLTNTKVTGSDLPEFGKSRALNVSEYV